VAEKSHYYPILCTVLRGEGEGGCFLYCPEDLLKKRELHLNYHQKHTENDILMETSETTKFVKLFCGAF
jgi:hypothetical protein